MGNECRLFDCNVCQSARVRLCSLNPLVLSSFNHICVSSPNRKTRLNLSVVTLILRNGFRTGGAGTGNGERVTSVFAEI